MCLHLYVEEMSYKPKKINDHFQGPVMPQRIVKSNNSSDVNSAATF